MAGTQNGEGCKEDLPPQRDLHARRISDLVFWNYNQEFLVRVSAEEKRGLEK